MYPRMYKELEKGDDPRKSHRASNIFAFKAFACFDVDPACEGIVGFVVGNAAAAE